MQEIELLETSREEQSRESGQASQGVGDAGATRYIPPQGQNQSRPGYSTQYSPQGQVPMTNHHGKDRDRTFFAILLIGAGVLFMLQQFSIFPSFGDYVLLIIGGVFMYAYFNTRSAARTGFLIPGAILLGIGAGQVLHNLDVLHIWQGGNLSALTLGLGFCLIWALERRHWWALIPGGILVASGISGALNFGLLWPVALIVLGGYLLYQQYGRGR